MWACYCVLYCQYDITAVAMVWDFSKIPSHWNCAHTHRLGIAHLCMYMYGTCVCVYVSVCMYMCVCVFNILVPLLLLQ